MAPYYQLALWVKYAKEPAIQSHKRSDDKPGTSGLIPGKHQELLTRHDQGSPSPAKLRRRPPTTAFPSECPDSEPMPELNAMGSVPDTASSEVIIRERKRTRQAWMMASGAEKRSVGYRRKLHV
jgi:hypothetical protein